jgi:hypothetical protein
LNFYFTNYNYLHTKMTTNKLQAGYQYLFDNNLIDNFQNYQFSELDINERKISSLDKFHILPPDSEENIARNIDTKQKLIHVLI